MNYYSCEPGYSFPDGEVEKLFWCSRDGIWLPTGLSCVRKCFTVFTFTDAQFACTINHADLVYNQSESNRIAVIANF